jgi:hypothetical protein
MFTSVTIYRISIDILSMWVFFPDIWVALISENNMYNFGRNDIWISFS